MKSQKLFIASLAVLLLASYFAKADISPRPVQVKGIIPSHPVNIQMVSEKVNVRLSMDTAWVECTFNMHNLGAAQDLEIGFPMMNFYLFQDKYPDQDKFRVWVDGSEVKKIGMHIPQDLQSLLKSDITFEHNRLIEEYDNQNKPWYLWKSHFDKNESQVIVVKYILPNGATKQNRFFNYLLSTGAGWAGKIERAEVIINTNDIPEDQILSITPKHYKLKEKQISWVFKNLEPTTADDILMKYEMEKGSYAIEKKKIDSIARFIDAKRKSMSRFITMNSNIAGLDINKRPPYEKYGAIYIYTNEYALKKFKRKIKPLDRGIWKQISKESATTLPNHYRLMINDVTISKKTIFVNLFSIDTTLILKINIKPTDSLKKDLILTVNKDFKIDNF